MPAVEGGATTATVEQGLRVACPELLFASRRVVRQLLRRDRDEPIAWLSCPHQDVALIESTRLREIAGDLVAIPPELPSRVAVIARPEAEGEAVAGNPARLRACWRLAFHALLDLAADAATASGRLDVPDILGRDAFAEARDVLVREGRLARDATDARAGAECAATFLELRCFDEPAVADWFPTIDDPGDVAVRLSAALDAEDLLTRTVPPGLDPESECGPDAPLPRPSSTESPWGGWARPRASVLRRRADRTALTGNLVRALLDEWRAATARPEAARPALGRFERLVDSLARRLTWSLDLDASSSDDARELIHCLVQRADGSSWSREARLLYDLQKLCVDSERESFRTHLLAWLLSAGRRPFAVPLPCQRLVMIHRHAVAAAARLPSLALPEECHRRGERLLAEATRTTAAAVRETLRPTLERSLDAADLQPASLVEDAAAAKLVEELLDGIVERGYASFGGVRDAISRNQLKLDDLASIREWLGGDELLRLDQRLAASLDGVYRPAPIYHALLQRASSPFFGTAAGRLLTTHVLLPFGGAWLLLRGLEHVIEPITEYSLGEMWHVYTNARMLAVGLVLWALIHIPAVRRLAWQASRAIAAGLHFVLFILPNRLLRLPVVDRLLRSDAVRWFNRHAASPLVVTTVAWMLLPRHGRWVSRTSAWFPPSLFAASAAFLNSLFGRQVQERAIEGGMRLLHGFHVHVIVGLLSWIVDAFRQAMDMVEGALYAVDESLRFRSDESGAILAVKAVAGAIWSVIESVVRFCITLLIEPQLNPIKHFPVVTVSHKLLVPMIPVVASQIVAATGMERGLALTAVTFVSTALPGVFGFLAWELHENWRLYAANRPRTLRPVPVGHHGETIRRLLLPGFHSGTLPRLFALIRRQGRRGAGRRSGTRQRHDLEHAVAAFVERDIIALLDRCTAASALGVVVERVELSVVRIRIWLRSARYPAAAAAVVDLVRSGSLIESRVVEPGWITAIDGQAAREVRLALAGFHRLAAADAATAAFAEMPDASPPVADAEGLAAVRPINWTAWSTAWERGRGEEP